MQVSFPGFCWLDLLNLLLFFFFQVMECLEAYGTERGKIKCKTLIEDFNECVSMKKQLLRFHVSFPRNSLSFQITH